MKRILHISFNHNVRTSVRTCPSFITHFPIGPDALAALTKKGGFKKKSILILHWIPEKLGLPPNVLFPPLPELPAPPRNSDRPGDRIGVGVINSAKQ